MLEPSFSTPRGTRNTVIVIVLRFLKAEYHSRLRSRLYLYTIAFKYCVYFWVMAPWPSRHDYGALAMSTSNYSLIDSFRHSRCHLGSRHFGSVTRQSFRLSSRAGTANRHCL